MGVRCRRLASGPPTEVANHHIRTDPEVGRTAANVEAAIAMVDRK